MILTHSSPMSYFYTSWKHQKTIAVLKNFANCTRKHLFWSLFLIKLQVLRSAQLLKKTPRQVFSCEICYVFKNTFFYRIPPVAAFAFLTKFKKKETLILGMSIKHNEDLLSKYSIIYLSPIQKKSVKDLPCFRSSRPEVFGKNGVLRNFAKSTCARDSFK